MTVKHEEKRSVLNVVYRASEAQNEQAHKAQQARQKKVFIISAASAAFLAAAAAICGYKYLAEKSKPDHVDDWDMVMPPPAVSPLLPKQSATYDVGLAMSKPAKPMIGA